MAKEKRSIRDYLGTDGKVVANAEIATGARFTLVEAEGEDYKPIKAWDQQMGPAGTLPTMCATLGFHTKLGNVANTVLNDKDAPGSLKDAAEAIDAFIAAASATPPVWAERGAGAGVQRYDAETMLACIKQVTGKDRSDRAAWRVDAKGNQVQADAKGEFPKGSKSYFAFAYGVAAIREAYDKARGTGASVDQL